MTTTYYVYEHIRRDNGAVFYVGKGKGKRAFDAKNRNNKYWKRVVEKCGGFDVKFVAKDIDEELALLCEIERIDQLKRIGVKLTNLTNGGDGASGRFVSDEEKRGMSQRMSGKNNPMFGMTGEKNYMFGKTHSLEIRKKLSEVNKNRKISEETRLKLRNRWVNTGHPKAKKVIFNNIMFKTIGELAKYENLPYPTVSTRIQTNPSKWGYEVINDNNI